MDEIISEYVLAFDEINALTAYSYESNVDSKFQADKTVDDILSLLITAYTLGIKHASTMLEVDLSVDPEDMTEAIYFLIDGMTFEDRAREHIFNEDLTALQILVESEYHRVYNTAVMDGGREYRRLLGGAVIKKWLTVGDNKVRDTHRYLEGQKVDIEELFFTYDGDYAAYPGGFTKASNNVNCRCIVQLTTNII